MVVLGLPRGGVPVAAEVARILGAPLDVIVVRKLGVPWQPELAMGALGEDGVEVRDERVIRSARVQETDLLEVAEREGRELAARVSALRSRHPRLDLAGRTAVVVDDGVATGSTARAACLVAHGLGARRVVLAVPVGAAHTLRSFLEADTVVSVLSPSQFSAVGAFYDDFSATTDAEVQRLLDASRDVSGSG